MIEIRQAITAADFVQIGRLFREYADSLGISLDFQGFEQELAMLPGKYATPGGRLLLAQRDSEVLGCVALRPLSDGVCEMKRLYVRPQARGEQLGRRLVERICAEARDAGYSSICLDTLPTMASAQKLYESLGFEPIGSYVFNPIAGTRFLSLKL